jgi:hypothetical protein
LHDRIIREKFRDNVGGKLVQLGAEELIGQGRNLPRDKPLALGAAGAC